MTNYIYEAYRKYEGRVENRKFAADLETAKELARNMVHLESPPNWIQEEHWEWELEDYGELGEGCYIKKHILKGPLE